MNDFVVGVDSGSTAVKVTIFDLDGSVHARGSSPTPRSEVRPGRVERDPEAHWRVVADTVRRTVMDSGIPPDRMLAVGVAGHGDGLHLVDAAGDPVGPAILSSDTRADEVVSGWAVDGTLAALRDATGQIPFPGSPAPLLRWLIDNEPERLIGARWILSAKDWLRLRMTGVIGTDRTDAAASFADADDHSYSAAALSAVGLSALAEMLPAIAEPSSVGARLTASGAGALGLLAGTPVSAGLHDVAASILGSVGLEMGRMCMIVGTFGVNVVLTASARRSVTLNTRSGPAAGYWASRRTSRASIANLEWIAAITGGADDRDTRTRAVMRRSLTMALPHDPPVFVPFLFGGNAGQPGSAAFLGLRSWHGPDDLVRGVVEGITFNHRLDSELIAEELTITGIHLAGGIVHDADWRQLFADVLERPVSFAPGDDAGPRGAAITAAVGLGAFSDLESGARAFAPRTELVSPGPGSAAVQGRYERYRDAVVDLAGRPTPTERPALMRRS